MQIMTHAVNRIGQHINLDNYRINKAAIFNMFDGQGYHIKNYWVLNNKTAV